MKDKWIKKEPYYLNKLLKLKSKKTIDAWLIKNPPPKEWQVGKYAWAYTEMMILN